MRDRPAVDPEEALRALQGPKPTHLWRTSNHVEELRTLSRETQTWCARHVDLAQVARCLRDQSIAPSPLPKTRGNAVSDVLEARHRDLRRSSDANIEVPSGRFLLYFPDADLTDGAAEVESGGFFDVYNTPPWGTWVGYFTEQGAGPSFAEYLLAWVPEAFVPLASAGIDVNPEECIVWLRDTRTELKRVFEALGIEP